MTDNADRLLAIRAQCQERGWKFGACDNNWEVGLLMETDKKGRFVVLNDDEGVTMLEALLRATAPGAPVVEIEVDDNGDCCPCGLWNYDYHNGCGANLQESYKNPGPNCPGPGTYRLVKVVE